MFHHEEAMKERRRKWAEASAGKKTLIIAGWLVIVAGFLALVSLVVMLLWNRIMSGILGLPAFGFWESLGLFVLARILFGGRGGSLMGKMRMRRVMRERMARRNEGEGENVD